MNQLARRPLPHMTADDFLAWPGDGTGRTFQLVDGEVRPVSPASHTHAAIQSNLAYSLIGAVRAAGLPLQVLTEGAIIPGLNASTNVRVPDLVVTATPDERGQQTVPDPVLIEFGAIGESLRAGWRDFRRAPGFGLFFSAFYVAGGLMLAAVAAASGQEWWLIPFVCLLYTSPSPRD